MVISTLVHFLRAFVHHIFWMNLSLYIFFFFSLHYLIPKKAKRKKNDLPQTNIIFYKTRNYKKIEY